MVHRDNRKGKGPRGTLVIDRVFRGVGRLKRASGTTDPRVHRKIDRCLTDLADHGRLDVLRALRDVRELTPLMVLEAWQRNELHKLPIGDTLAELAGAWGTYADTRQCSEKHRADIRQAWKYLERHAKAGARIAELADLLFQLRKNLDAKGHGRAFNKARAAALAFVRDTLKRSHQLHAEIRAIDTLPVTSKRLKRPQTVAGLVEILKAVDNDVAACAWSMASSGMGPEEYWGSWQREPGARLHVRGTKRLGRDRYVPDAAIAVTPPITRAAFKNRWQRQVGSALSPYDLRRTFANWCEKAGIQHTRIRLYLGHGPRDVSDIYLWHDVLPSIAQDASTLSSWIDVERKRGLQLVEQGEE